MKENIYGAAFIKSLEKNMFRDSDFVHMLAYSGEDIKEVLSSHGYEGKTLEEMLKNEEAKTRKICRELCKNKEILELIFAKDSFHNIKTALKCALSGIGGKSLFITPTDVDTEGILKAAKTGNFKKLQEGFSEYAKEAYKKYKSTGILGTIDRCLDRFMTEYILEKSLVSEFARGWAEMYAETAMIKEEFFGDKKSPDKKPPAQLFRELDDAVTEYLKKAHFFFFDENVVLAYFLGKETEIKNLRLVLYGINGGNMELVKERLRKTYV